MMNPYEFEKYYEDASYEKRVMDMVEEPVNKPMFHEEKRMISLLCNAVVLTGAMLFGILAAEVTKSKNAAPKEAKQADQPVLPADSAVMQKRYQPN